MRLAPLAAAALAFLAGCQDPDVGQACTMRYSGGTQGGDWFETGNFECVNPICIRSILPAGSKVKNNPYCSKACVSNRDCFNSDTGLVCRAVVLDQDFLSALPAAVRDQYLGDVQISSYCAAPVP
jgi:hypothetical protein